MLAQVIQESKAECGKALRYLAEIKVAFPEVLQAIKSKQLAQEILLFKEDQIGNLAKTGDLHKLSLAGCLGANGFRMAWCSLED